MEGKHFNKKNNIKFPEKNNDQFKNFNDTISKFVLKGDKNKFKDYLQLKTQGKDQFDEKYEVICYLWYLRGLPIEMSIRKVKTDIEVSHNFRH